jgi:3-hydroxyacyl-[acyl-carrier-protein] dehydratase
MTIPIAISELPEFLPQAEPFRFVDRVLEVDDRHIVAAYRFRPEESYYRGHFPGSPLTPGVILLECMAQCGIVLHGIYLLAKEAPREEILRHRGLFTGANVEWHAGVRPGEEVVVRGELMAWRRRRIRSRVVMTKETGELVATGELAGMGVSV